MGEQMKAAQISKPGGDWELVEREIPEPQAGQVRVKVEACGICHSDVLVKEGLWPGLQFPRVPGHEVAGHIHGVGTDVSAWKVGQRVGSVGTVDIVSFANSVAEATSRCVSIARLRVLISMAVTPNT